MQFYFIPVFNTVIQIKCLILKKKINTYFIMKVSDKFNNILNLIISRHPLDIEETGRRKLLTVFLLMIIPADIFFGLYQMSEGLYSIAILDFILALTMASCVFILRRLANGKPLYRAILLLYSLVLIYYIKTGGRVQGYGSIWALFQPLFAFFLLGEKEGFIWTVSFIVTITAFFINPCSYLSDFTYSPLFISRFLPTYLMIFIFTFSYENVRQKYKSAMKAEQTKLNHEKEKLAEAKEETERTNRLLKTEMKIREQAEMELREHHDRLEDIVAERTLEIKKSSEKLEASEKRYRLMADNVNDIIWSTDIDLNFIFISPSVFRLYGYTVEEAMVLPHEKWNTPESYKRVMEIYHEETESEKKGTQSSDKYIVLQLDHVKKSGEVFPVEVKVSIIRNESGIAIGVVGITRDITDRIAAEQEKEKIKEQLAQSQKLEALGTLIGGLAHDFNNFLSGIIGGFNLVSLALKKENLTNKDYIEKYLNLGMESSKRSAGLINQLLILSKKHEITLAPLDITNSINNIYELCRNSFPKSIELEFSSERPPLIIMGDMVQIEQVLLNFCINASHAMTIMRPRGVKHGGKLTLTAEKISPDYIMKENYPEEVSSVDYWIRVKISDTGVGMDSTTRQRIFEPFFSTKDKNESSGLGLAISYNIIRKHGGLVNVYSEPGSGSCFSIYFPVYDRNEEMVTVKNEPEIANGHGTVLVIDDEPVILKIAEGFLEQCGYDVITAEGADSGLKIYRDEFTSISVVLIDLSMPGKSGIETFHELKKINQEVKVIISSGMLDSESKDHFLEMGVKDTINKPYTAAELSLKVRSVLDKN